MKKAVFATMLSMSLAAAPAVSQAQTPIYTGDAYISAGTDMEPDNKIKEWIFRNIKYVVLQYALDAAWAVIDAAINYEYAEYEDACDFIDAHGTDRPYQCDAAW